MAKKETKSAIDRSQFESTPIRAMKKNAEDDNRKADISGGGKAGTIKLKDGQNTIRFAPKRKGEKSWYLLTKGTWMKLADDKGNEISRKIPDSTVHGGTKLDVLKAYVDYCKEVLPTKGKKGEAKMAFVVGVKNSKTQQGILPKTSWICYGWNKVKEDGGYIWQFGEFEFGKGVRTGLEDAAVAEDEDEEITLDPYTDLENGKAAIITQNSKAKSPGDYYKVALSDKKTPLTDDMLAELLAAPKLTERIRGYGMKEFEQALEAIQYFDDENKIGLFEDEEFQEIVETIREQYESDDDDEDEDDEPQKKSTKKPVAKGKKVADDDDDEDEDDDDDEEEEEEVPVKKKVAAKKPVVTEDDDDDEDEDDDDDSDDDEDEEEEEEAPFKDEFDEMDRDELKEHIEENSLDITVKKSMTDDAIRTAIRALAPKKKPVVAAAKGKPSAEDIKARLKAKTGKK